MTRSGDKNDKPTSDDMTASYEAAQPKELRSTGQNSGGGRTRLEPRVQSALGRELRQMYDGMVSQPVPERFVALLDALENRESKGGDGGEDKG